MKELAPAAFRGWKGLIHYFKSFSQKVRIAETRKLQEETLLLYFDLQRLIREKCTSFGIKESKTSEFKFYFREARQLTDLQDIEYFLNTMKHVKQRLEANEYPPFPTMFPSILSRSLLRETLNYRKFIWNVNKDDLILEPGQDPVRQPFIEPKQFSSDIIDDHRYFRHDLKGEIFSDEEKVFEGKSREVVKYD